MPYTVQVRAQTQDVKVTDTDTGQSLTYSYGKARQLLAALVAAEGDITAAQAALRTREARRIGGLLIAAAGSAGVFVNPTRAWELGSDGVWSVYVVPAHLDALLLLHSGKPIEVGNVRVAPPVVTQNDDGWLVADYGDLRLIADGAPQFPPLP